MYEVKVLIDKSCSLLERGTHMVGDSVYTLVQLSLMTGPMEDHELVSSKERSFYTKMLYMWLCAS